MKSSVFTSRSEQDTVRFARELASSLTPPVLILLFGELGAGKTYLTKGLAAGFGFEDSGEVQSPTFTLVNRYAGRVPIYHVDLYRIEPGDFGGLGLEEIFDDPDAVAVIEWAERLGNLMPAHAVHIGLTYVDVSTRTIEVRHV